MSTLNVESISHPTPGSNVTVNGITPASTNSLGLRNLFINGAMQVAQRTTASQSHSTAGSIYGVDRFYAYANVTGKVTVQQNQGSVTPPAGFQKYVGITSSGAYTSAAGNVFSFGQPIEAQNAEQLAWGTADAKAVTLSFWVRSSLTGTFGGAFLKQGLNRSYPYSYTIDSANTWEYKTITIPGDTDTSVSYNMSGNGLFGYFIWDYGSGDNVRGTAGAWTSSQKEGVTGTNRLVSTSGATWQITGVQLEVGSVATPFEHRSYGDELARCQRYYYRMTSTALYTQFAFCNVQSATVHKPFFHFPVPLRVPPTAVEHSNLGIITAFGFAVTGLSGLTLDTNLNGTESTTLSATLASPGLSSAGATTVLLANNTGTASISFVAEL